MEKTGGSDDYHQRLYICTFKEISAVPLGLQPASHSPAETLKLSVIANRMVSGWYEPYIARNPYCFSVDGLLVVGYSTVFYLIRKTFPPDGRLY